MDYSNLSDGSYTFYVRAKDTATNVELHPASYTWTIDTDPPGLIITPTTPTPPSVAPDSVLNFPAMTPRLFSSAS